MRIRKWNIAHIPRGEIKRPRRRWGGEDCGARVPADEEVPLIAIGVPVDFAHCTRLDDHEGDAEVEGNGEGGRVDDLDGAAGYDVRVLLGEMIGVGIAGNRASWASDILGGKIGGGGCAGEDVELRLGQILECRDVGAEIFCED